MSHTNISVEVHCLQPNWIQLENAQYRFYVNDDLITERSWIWDFNTVINETLTVDVPPTLSNNIRIEVIKPSRASLAQFGLRNLKINGWPKPDHGGHRDNLSFIIE